MGEGVEIARDNSRHLEKTLSYVALELIVNKLESYCIPCPQCKLA